MQTLLQGIREEIGFVFPENTVYQQREKGLSLTLENGKYTVGYSSAADIARAALLAKRNNGIAEYRLQEQSDYDDLCFMVDCSRNAVHNLPTVKKLIRNIAMLGFNSIMLYTEDTYQIKDEPVCGYLRGGYTIEEMKEIDAYACSFGIEVIPCIQTLAHLRGLKRWYADYQGIFDCEDILMVGEERVYALIENMFKTLHAKQAASLKELIQMSISRMEMEASVDELENAILELNHRLGTTKAELNSFIQEWRNQLSETMVTVDRNLSQTGKRGPRRTSPFFY